MERSDEGARTPARVVAGWRYALLVAACVAGGLTLTVMVIGPDRIVSVEASPATTPAAGDTVPPADGSVESSIASDLLVETTVSPTSSDEVGSGDLVAAPAVSATPFVGAAVPVQTSPVGGPSAPLPATPAPAVVVPTPAPTAAPAPSPTPATTVTPATTAGPPPTTVAVPAPAPVAPTAAPTTPPPTVGLTYPTFQASSSGAVTLAFDGSTISVASVSPQANWVFEVEKNGPRTVEVKFFNVVTKQDDEFHAALEGGRIKVEN